MARKPLTPKQQAFVAEYLVDLNATQAAVRAGYSAKTASETGYENLRKPQIAAAVSEAFAARAKRAELDQDWVLKRLLENVKRAMQAEPVTDREGLSTGEYTYQGNVANKALELLGKHLGMFGTKVELTGKDGGPIETKTEDKHQDLATRIGELIEGREQHE